MKRVTLDSLAPEDRELVATARAARDRAYTPYSKFWVGGAVRSKSGAIYAAPNIEIVTLQQSVHAERNAVNQMAAAGERRIAAVVCYGPGSAIPCAECRQVIWEFCAADPDTPVFGATLDGMVTVTTMGELYPIPYGPETLGVDPEQH